MDSLPDQILLQMTHIQGVSPDQTTQPAAEGSDWWTASKAQTEPKQKGRIISFSGQSKVMLCSQIK